MNKKLEEYRDRKFNSITIGLGEKIRKELEKADLHCKEGFDAAIALDLPVKFAEWKDSLDKHGAFDEMTYQELFDYWIENILNLDV